MSNKNEIMRKLGVFVCSVLLMSLSFAQNLPKNEKTGKVTYMEVVSADGADLAALHKLVKEWGEEKGWTITENVDGSKVKFDAFTKFAYPSADGGKMEEGTVQFTLAVMFKDGRYRYIATDFVHVSDVKGHNGGKLEGISPECSKTKVSGRAWVHIKNTTDKRLKAFSADINRIIREHKNDPENDDNW